VYLEIHRGFVFLRTILDTKVRRLGFRFVDVLLGGSSRAVGSVPVKLFVHFSGGFTSWRFFADNRNGDFFLPRVVAEVVGNDGFSAILSYREEPGVSSFLARIALDPSDPTHSLNVRVVYDPELPTGCEIVVTSPAVPDFVLLPHFKLALDFAAQISGQVVWETFDSCSSP